MKEPLHIRVVPMNDEIMDDLEKRGLIMRLMPSRDDHRLSVPAGTGKGDHMYKSPVRFGGHSLIRCAIDNPTFSSFATHPHHEEFLLLGGVREKRMLLLVALIKREEFNVKLTAGVLTGDDFICLDCTFNDPSTSFFVMHADVPHGECAIGAGRPVTFYVTEGSRLPLDKIPLYDRYDLIIEI